MLGYAGRGTGDRDRWRRRSESKRATGQDFCGNDPNSNFRRSTGALRPHRLAHLDLAVTFND